MVFQTQCKLFPGILLYRQIFLFQASPGTCVTSLSVVSQHFFLNVFLLRGGEYLGGIEKALTRLGCQRVPKTGWVPDRTGISENWLSVILSPKYKASWRTNCEGSTTILKTKQNDSDWASSLRNRALHDLSTASQREHEPTKIELAFYKLLLTPLYGLSAFGRVVQENLARILKCHRIMNCFDVKKL